MSFAALGPADTYTLERGNRIEFSVQSDTLYEQIQDADSPAVASGSLSANFTWTMPTSLQEDASSYLRTYTNFIQIDSDFSLNAQVNDFEGDEAGLRPAPYNGNHSDEWNLSSKAFLTGKESSITPAEKSCGWWGPRWKISASPRAYPVFCILKSWKSARRLVDDTGGRRRRQRAENGIEGKRRRRSPWLPRRAGSRHRRGDRGGLGRRRGERPGRGGPPQLRFPLYRTG